MFLYFLLLISFLDTMAQLPILVLYINHLHATAIMTGVIMASYSLSNLVANIFNGYISDIYGRKIAIIAGMIIAGTAVIFYGLINTPNQLLFVRIIHGLGGGILVPAIFALIGDIHKKGSVGKSMGYSGAAVGLAALLGPMLAGIGKDALGFSTFFIFLGSLIVVTAILAIFLLPYDKKSETKVELNFNIIRNLFLDKRLQIGYISALGVTFSQGALAFQLPLHLQSLGYATKYVGLFLSLFAFTAIIIFLSPISRRSDRRGRLTPIKAGYVFLMASFMTLLFSNSSPLFMISMIFFGLGFGLIFPAMNAVIVDNADPLYRGSAFGIFYAVFSLGIVIGQFLSGVALELSISPYLVTFLANLIVLITLSIKTVKVKV
ncbi:MAG: MFS transporter [Syntrophomonadaceae bacterium]|nr:MFS transporter [Syntrophomonadaceae bacterium]